MKKHILLILLSVFSLGTIQAEITWTLSDDGTLTISGTDMPDYDYLNDILAPWDEKKINKVVIENGVTNIGNYAFCSLPITSITIPKSVKKIGEGAFQYCSALTSITIPNSVTSIGDWAFNGSGLTSIIIPNSITSIGWNTFSGCPSLTSVTIPNSVQNIGMFAFSGCSALTSVNIGNSVTSIDSYAFYRCPSLASITIPNSVKSIGKYAFYECLGLTSVIIGNSVTSIGHSAFYCCSSLISVTIGNSVTSIGDYAFEGCSDITSINIPASVTSIGFEAFFGCSSLKSISIPYSVTSIGDNAFCACSGLTSITVDEKNTKYDNRNNCNAIIEKESNTLIVGCKNTIIPNSVTSIKSSAFYGCSDLTSITIPESVTCIEDYAFGECSNLTSIIVEKRNKNYDSRNDCNAIIEKESNTLIAGCMNTIIPNSVTSIGNLAFANCKSLTSITIPNSVTSIKQMAFYGCSGLTSITIPNSVTSIGVQAFQGCFGLTSVTIPNSMTSIGNSAFSGCSGLTSVTIPNSVRSIGDNTFYNCSGLTSVTIPNSVSSIGFSAFNGCSGLTSITCEASTPPYCDYYCFYNVNKSIPIYVPANSVKAYKKAKEWKNFTNIQAIIVEPTSISFADASENLIVGKTMKLEATITPEDATNKTIIWTSSNTDVATISSEGIVTAKGAGTTIITATTNNGKTAKCTITVEQPVTAIALSDATTSLWVGKTKTLTATVTPTTSSNTAVNWSSSDNNVATVSSKGVITAKSKGTCTITCTAADGYGAKSTCEVTVKQQVTEIALSETTASLWVGETNTIKATATPTTANNTNVSWSSSNKNVATVSSKGVITAKGEGTCTITCTAADGYGTKSTCEVTVKQQVTEIVLSETTASLWVGDTKTITATALPTTANNTSVEWTSSDDKVASVSSEGVITANGEGACIITCTAADGYGAVSVCEVTVMQQATSLEDLRFANDKSPVYNLNGQRINKAHAQKGIYIKNGKKYANKN